MRQNYGFFAVVALLAILGATAASAMGKRPDPKTATSTDKASLKVCELAIDGMTCGGCERAVEAALSKDDGFADAEVSHQKGNAVVRYDPNKTTPEKLAQLIEKRAGYKTSVKEAKP